MPIALHHGSLDVAQRRKVEAAMAAGRLRAVVCTSSLDLGVDWGDVDLVINVGAPKGASRMLQRIGRANHRMDEPSKGVLVPANRFEVLECRAALDAIAENAQDTPALAHRRARRAGAACARLRLRRAVLRDELYAEVTTAAPYAALSRADFDAAVDFVATGGYALKAYERFARIRQGKDGRWRVANPRVAQRYRLNVGTIVEADMLQGPAGALARLEDSFRAAAGCSARSRNISSRRWCRATRSCSPARFSNTKRWSRTRSTSRARRGRSRRCRPMRAANFRSRPISPHGCATSSPTRRTGASCRPRCANGWKSSSGARRLPGRRELLVETFPRGGKSYLVCYPFEGRLAHQTLGMLLTRRLERARLRPLGFVANEYALAVWGLGDVAAAHRAAASSRSTRLFDEDMLGDDLEAWLAESALMKRTFRNCAIIAGLIERRFPGEEKSRRQVTISTDLVYDVLRSHQPDHMLLRAARADAATGLLDVRRLAEMLSRIKGRIVHKALDHVSPLAVPVMLEIGRETVYGEAAMRFWRKPRTNW